MRQGYHHFEDHPALRAFLSSSRDIIVTEIAMNEEFPEELFRMEFREGVQTYDHRFDGIGVYNYRKDMTEQDWERIRAEARKRAEDDGKRPPTTH